MKLFIVLFLSVLVFISSCSSTHQLLNYTEIKDKTEGRNVLIKLKNDEEIEGEIVEVDTDSILNKKLMFKENIIIPISVIKRIHFRSYSKGAIDGLRVGGHAGFIVGAIAGAFLVGESPTGRGSGAGWWIIPAAGAIVGMGWGIVGMPFGAIIGHKNKYILNSTIPNEYIIINFPLADQIKKENEFVKIEVAELDEKNPEYLSLIIEGESVEIPKRFVTKIDYVDDRTFITLPQIVYSLIKSKIIL